MRWCEFDTAIRAHFAKASSEALDLNRLVTSLADSEDDLDDLEFIGPYQLMADQRSIEGLLSFEWLSFPGSGASVDLMNIEHGYRLACLNAEEEPYYGFDLLGPHLGRQDYARFVEKLIASNGTDFGVQLFGGPPGRITNHMPDLVGVDTIKLAFRRYIDWAVRNDQLFWVTFRDQARRGAEVLGPSETMQRIAAKVEGQFGPGPMTVEAIDAYLDRQKAESDAMSQEEREAVFELYFEGSYCEVRETQASS